MQTRSVRLDLYTECGKPGYARKSFRHLAADKAASDDYVHAEARRMSEAPGTLRVVAVETAPMRGDVATLAAYEHGTRTDQPATETEPTTCPECGGDLINTSQCVDPYECGECGWTPPHQMNDDEPDNSTEYDDEEY